MTNGFSNCSRKKNQNNGTQNGTDHRRHSDSEEDSAQDSFGNNFKSNMKIRNVFEKIIQKKFLKITVKKKAGKNLNDHISIDSKLIQYEVIEIRSLSMSDPTFSDIELKK